MRTSEPIRSICIASLLLVPVCLTPPARAYSVLTHKTVIDWSWADSIEPLLLNRYPDTTARQLEEARAYAYGGALIPDMGYFPFGSRFFSDLIHYVRGGDFTLALL